MSERVATDLAGEASMDAKRHVVVAVRSAADDAPAGSALRALAAGLSTPPGSYQPADLFLGCELYPRLTSAVPAQPDLIEVGCGGSAATGAGGGRWLRRTLELIAGLPAVCSDWGQADPGRRTRQVYRDVAEAALLWTVWPVLLTLVHTVAASAARPNRMLLDAAVLGLLAWLVRSYGCSSGHSPVAGRVWFGLCLLLCAGLWWWPQYRVQATAVSIRVYGLGQLLGAVVLLVMGIEVGLRTACRKVAWRQGLTAFALAALPFALASLLVAGLWAVVLNLTLALGGGPVLEALKNWQQGFAAALGYRLAVAEWGAAVSTVLVAVLAAAGGLHCARAQRGELARRWLLVISAVIALGAFAVALGTLLTSPYLRAPLANALRRIGPNSDVATVFTWSALRLVPWILLLLTPLRGVLAVLAELGLQLLPLDEARPSTRDAEGDRLTRLLRFLDRGCYDRIHVLAHGQAAVVAMQAVRGADWHHPLVLTALGSPAGPLYRDLLGLPLAAQFADVEWYNLYRRGDPIGGPLGDEAVDVPLDGGGGHQGYWSEPQVAAWLVQALQPSA